VSERIEVYKDMAGEWRWRRIAGNGLNIANSSEGYKNLTHCLEMAQHVNGESVSVVVDGDETEGV